MATLHFLWIHTFNPNLLLTVSPFYHYTNASYQGLTERLSSGHQRGSDFQLWWVTGQP